jgi:thioredoxin 1
MQEFRNFILLAIVVLSACSAPQIVAQNTTDSSAGFAPLEQWKSALLAGDAAALKGFYSTNPPAQLEVNGGVGVNVDAEVNFWIGLKARSLAIQIVRLKEKPTGESVIFKANVDTETGSTLNVTVAQGWQKQGEQWRIAGVERTNAPQLSQPSDMNKNIYPPDADAHAELKEAEDRAAAGHKRVLLVFGANWCYDCHILDLAFHRPDFASAMAGYEVVHVDLGDDEQKNLDLVKQFEIPLKKGIPALAVVSSGGKLIVSQKNGEFEDARSMTPAALLQFLNQWKPSAQ